MKNDKITIMPALSNNSHELFHSNLWAWLIDNDQIFIKVFFKSFDISKYEKIEREKKHKDITITDKDGNKYVIENKFKSTPNKEQLIKYTKDIDKNGKSNKYLLAFLIDYNFKVKKWDSINYLDISKAIRDIVSKNKCNNKIKKYKWFLIEYCDYIDGIINKIYQTDYIRDHYYYRNGAIPQEIIDDPMKVIFMKMKIENFKKFACKKIDKTAIVSKFEGKGYTLNTKTSFNNGKTNITFCVQKKRDANVNQSEHTAIEIQIEAGQYRYMSRIIDRKQNKNYKEAFKIFDNLKFYNQEYNKKNNNIVHNHKSKMNKVACEYKGKRNGTRGIYQYYNLDDKTPYNILADSIINDLNYIYHLIMKPRVKEFLDN